MQSDKTEKKLFVSEGKGKSKKKQYLLGGVLFLLLALTFVGGVQVGKIIKTNEVQKGITSSVGTKAAPVESYEIELLGKKIQYTEDQETNTGIDRDLLFSLNEQQLKVAKIDDLIVLYVKANDINATDPKALLAKTLEARAKELSQQQRQQLQGSGLAI
jgi:hypothetical protein